MAAALTGGFSADVATGFGGAGAGAAADLAAAALVAAGFAGCAAVASFGFLFLTSGSSEPHLLLPWLSLVPPSLAALRWASKSPNSLVHQ